MTHLKRHSPWIAALLVAASLGLFATLSVGQGITPSAPVPCSIELPSDAPQRLSVMQREACNACIAERQQACIVLTERFFDFFLVIDHTR